MTTRTRTQSLFTTHSREKERARLARTLFTALSRSQSSFFYIGAFARLVQQFVLFSEKKDDDFSKSIFFLETNNKTKTRAIERVQNATRERESRAEKGERERERERKKEGTRTGGFTGSLFGTGHFE